VATYEGGCHCGRVAFAVEGDIEKLFECNCSICTKRGALHWFVGREQFKLKTPDGDAGVYSFYKHKIRYRSCPVCGISPYAEGERPDGAEMIAVNARCLDGADIAGVPVVAIDGRSF
jgi:hypothetical protein